MPLYRTRRPLRRGKQLFPKGALTRLERLSQEKINALLANGTVSEVAPPPLNILPGWKEPAEKLKEIGVKTAVDFLEAHVEPISRVLKITKEEVKVKKQDLESWLMPDSDEPVDEGG